MATDCPCKCGRRLGPGAVQMARRSVEIAQLLSVLEQLRVDAASAERDVDFDFDAGITQGNALGLRFLQLAHDDLPAEAGDPARLREEIDELRRRASDWEAATRNLRREQAKLPGHHV